MLIHSDDGEGDLGVEKYEELNIGILSLLPKVLYHKNPAINDMVKILANQFKTLPAPTTYILYQLGISRLITQPSNLPTSGVRAPALVIS